MMKGATAQVHKVIEKTKKGEEPKRKEKTMVIKLSNLEDLIGDGNASIGRSKTIKMSLPYGEAGMSSTCTVHLTCNQDIKSIQRASVLCAKIVDKMLEEDQVEIAKFIEEMRDA